MAGDLLPADLANSCRTMNWQIFLTFLGPEVPDVLSRAIYIAAAIRSMLEIRSICGGD